METQKVADTKKATGKALTTQNGTTNSLALTDDLQGSWGAEESTSDDIIIPKLLLMQAVSEKVQDGEKSLGEIVKSTDWKTLAKKGEKVNVIPFKIFKTWRLSEIDAQGQAEWRGEEPWTPMNTDLPWDYEITGEDGKTKKMRRDQAYNFYAILTDEVGKNPFPVKMQFTRTSRKAGRVLADHFSKMKTEGRPPALQTFNIGSDVVKGEKNTYQIFTAEYGTESTLEQVQTAKKWFDIINKAGAKVQDHEVEERTEVVRDEANSKF